MKTKKLILLSGLVTFLLVFSGFKTVDQTDNTICIPLYQEGLIVYATYDGHEDYGYNFITKDKEGEERTLTFQKVEDTVLKTFDLNVETLVGTKFKITFNRVIKITKDADGVEDEDEINTIIKLEKL